MDGEELQALLAAAAREIGAVAAELKGEGGDKDKPEKPDPVCSQVLEARAAVEEAITAASFIRSETSEVAQEALALRAEAVRARDVAETRLWAIQDEHAELLERLQRLTHERARKSEEQRMEAEMAAEREADLVARCEELGDQVRWLRADVDRKSQRLIASSTLGHSLDLSRRRLQRQHDGSLEENTVAREILALQQSTEAYLQRMQDERETVNESLASAHKQFQERMEKLRTEWGDQQARYQDEMSTLQNRLTDLQSEYERRWSATDQEAKEKIEEKARSAAEVRSNFEEKLANLDAEWESEAAAARDELDRQKQLLVDARQAAVSEMEAKLSERQQELQGRVDVERQRCTVLRNKQQRRILEYEGEVNKYRSHIQELSATYRSKRRVPTSPTTPHKAVVSPGRVWWNVNEEPATLSSSWNGAWGSPSASAHQSSPRSTGLPEIGSRSSSRPGSRQRGFLGVQE